ncbi:hypothetical protein NQ318_008874 [Aromia moschata]|uniref:Ribosomal protein L20 n=1 Tax=Aromia moschata TaxID=1265417 RepID=A0AAV8ZAF1_9CUCU|nr:hypothetical protein NQ318_008874 [Aromia moschata]
MRHHSSRSSYTAETGLGRACLFIAITKTNRESFKKCLRNFSSVNYKLIKRRFWETIVIERVRERRHTILSTGEMIKS